MMILVLDSEAYGVEYLLWRASDDAVLARGSVTGIGGRTAILRHHVGMQGTHQLVDEIPNCRSAIKWIVGSLVDPKVGVLKDTSEIGGVGHRVAHGASKYSEPVLITPEVLDDIADFADFAPKHNPFNLQGIKAAKSILSDVPHVAVFDTSYYMTLAPRAYLYGLPYKYFSQYGVRKYGFHGPSHRYASERACYLAGIPFEKARIISMHLGKGASVTATKGGRCIETSMGFSPLEGLVMETRSGDVDPEAIIYIMAKEELSLRTLSDVLHRRSGVLGLAGLGDFGEVVAKAQQGEERARNALEVFAHSARKYLGAFLVELGGVDVLVFTATIAESFPIVRKMICQGLDFVGIKIDDKVNNSVVGAEGEISAKDSQARIYTVPHNEELIIARRVYKALKT